MKYIITRFKNTTNISRTSFDRDKSFQINVVYRIQIEKRVKQYNNVTKKIRTFFFFCGLPGEIFFLTPGQMETIFFLGLNYDFLRCWELHTLSFDLSYFNETPFLFIQWRIKNKKKRFHYTLISKKIIKNMSQLTFTCSKSIKETLEKGVIYVQN